MATLDQVKTVLRDALRLGPQADRFDESTELLGNLPELDSMAVVAVITALEERFDLEFDDDEITAEIFETVGSLTKIVEQKLAS